MSLTNVRSRLAQATVGAALGVLVFAVALLPQVDSRKTLEPELLWVALLAELLVVVGWTLWTNLPRRLVIAFAFVELAVAVLWYVAAPAPSSLPLTNLDLLLSAGQFGFTALGIAALLNAAAAVVHPGHSKPAAPEPAPVVEPITDEDASSSS